MQTPSPIRKRLQGKRFLEALQSVGIEAHNASRNRRTGIYTVMFCDPNISDLNSKGTRPAREWAERITAAFEDAEVIDMYDSVAEWRPGKPVIFAQVKVRVKTQSA